MKHQVFSVIFLGTDDISLQGLNHLLRHHEFEVKGIVTQKSRRQGRGMRFLDSAVAQRAKELSLPVLTPDNLKDPDFLSQVKKLQAKWLVLISYGKILPPVLLSMFPERALNFHASLLPRWRGSAPIERAIMAGDKKLGMSLQVMTPHLDTGPLIGTRSFEMNMEMDSSYAFKKMTDLIQDLLTDLREYMKGRLTPVLQDETQVSYAQKIDKKESRIIWNESSLKIFNKIRALVKGPQAYTLYKGKRIKIYKAKWDIEHETSSSFQSDFAVSISSTELKNDTGFSPGQVVKTGSDHFKVACGDSSLSVIQVHPESKKIMSAGEYIRGYNLKEGDFFS